MQKNQTGLLAVASLLALVSCTSTAIPTHPASGEGRVQEIETVSYVVRMWTEPSVDLIMDPPIMAMMDQGQPVNRHLEVHIFDINTGAGVVDITPMIEITDQASGNSRGLPEVSACGKAGHRKDAPHFGNNLYASDGNYTVTVNVGGEIAVFDVSF